MIIRSATLVLKSLESLSIYFGGKWSCLSKKNNLMIKKNHIRTDLIFFLVIDYCFSKEH